MRTKKEIDVEIKKLKALKPFGQWKNKTASLISAAIDELTESFDYTSDEWNELSGEEQDLRRDADSWKRNEIEEPPSESWSGLAK
jgi:hypothetical protein